MTRARILARRAEDGDDDGAHPQPTEAQAAQPPPPPPSGSLESLIDRMLTNEARLEDAVIDARMDAMAARQDAMAARRLALQAEARSLRIEAALVAAGIAVSESS